MDDRTQRILSAPPARLLVSMATPNAIAFIVQASVSMAEVWFIGRLGTASLAAIALAFPLLMLTQMMSGGATGGAVTSSVARALGAGDVDRAERILWHALIVAIGWATVFLLAFLLLGRPFLQFLGGSGSALGDAMSYCTVLFTGGVFIWLMGTTSAMFRGMGDMKFPAMLMIASAFVQVPLSGCLVLGLGGAPQLGIVGAAVSVVASSFLMSTIMLWRLARGHGPLRLRWSAFAPSRALFRDILMVALPAALSPFLTVVNILSLTAIVGRFGEVALAGYGIGSRVEFLLTPLVFGLGAAMTSVVGINIGARQVARAERVGWTGSSLAAMLAGVVGIVLAAFPDPWIAAFTSDPSTHDAARSYIRIVGPVYAFQGLGLSLYFASQGAGNVTWPVIATILRVVIAVAGAFLLAFAQDLGLAGVYIAAAAGMVVYGSVTAASVALGAWRR